MSEKILKNYKSLSPKKNKSSSSSLSFSPEIVKEQNTARLPPYERYQNFRSLIERDPQQRFLDETLQSKLYPKLNEDTKRYIKQTYLLPDERLNIFLQDHEKNVKVLKESSIVHSSNKGIEKLFSSEKFIPSSLRQIKTLKNTFANNKYFIIIFNNYLKIINLFKNRNNDEEHKKIIEDLSNLFKTYNDKILNINNILDFIIHFTTFFKNSNIYTISYTINHMINHKRNFLIYYYEIIFAISTIIAYILNYLINHLYIYNNIDFIKNNNNTFLGHTILFDITEGHNIPKINNSKVGEFLKILYELYIFEIFWNLDIDLDDFNTAFIGYDRLFKFIILTSLFFNYNTSSSTDKLDYYKNNINLIIQRIKSSLRSSLRNIPRIGGQTL